jgi:hypothetical protein
VTNPSEEAIVDALRRSGYLFEADVAALLWNLNFHGMRSNRGKEQ